MFVRRPAAAPEAAVAAAADVTEVGTSVALARARIVPSEHADGECRASETSRPGAL